MGNSDWLFVQKILDLSEGHNNTKRARLIVIVLCQLRELRHAGHGGCKLPTRLPRMAVGDRRADIERGLAD